MPLKQGDTTYLSERYNVISLVWVELGSTPSISFLEAPVARPRENHFVFSPLSLRGETLLYIFFLVLRLPLINSHPRGK